MKLEKIEKLNLFGLTVQYIASFSPKNNRQFRTSSNDDRWPINKLHRSITALKLAKFDSILLHMKHKISKHMFKLFIRFTFNRNGRCSAQ